MSDITSEMPIMVGTSASCRYGDNFIFRAIVNGDMREAMKLFKNGGNISIPDLISALGCATANNHFQVIKLVADVSRGKHKYWLKDSFEIAIQNGNFPILRLLLKMAGCPLKDFKMDAEFLEAVKCKQLKIALFLLRRTSFCSRIDVFHRILSDEETYRQPECFPLIWEIVQELESDPDFWEFSRKESILDWIDAVRSAIQGSRHERRFVSWFSQFLPRAYRSTDLIDPDRWNNLNDECPITMRTLRSSSLVLGCTHCRNAFDGYALWRWFFENFQPKCPMCRSDMYMNTICEILI